MNHPRVRRLRNLITAALVVSAGLAATARADVVAEYLFWNSMGNAAGSAVKNLNEYRNQRQLWDQKIAEGKAKLERCGDCSDRAAIEKDLAYWQGTENQFQQFAGSAFAAVGMPRNVANWLGIGMPMAPGPSRAEWERQNQVIRPAWADERPPFCRQAVDEYVQCLKSFQARTGSLVTDAAKAPGGACYDMRKLVTHCGAENYEAFEREKDLQAARAAGKIIPEYVDSGSLREVYWGQVPDDFVPTLPVDIVRAGFEERSAGFRFSARKQGGDVIGSVLIQVFSPSMAVPSNDCFLGRPPRSEVERRVCEDLTTLRSRDRPLLLYCGYLRPDGLPTSTYGGEKYWYGSRPETADPKRLLSRASEHPVLLKIGEPRTECPLTFSEATKLEADWLARVDRLRSETPQISENTVLPEPEWMKQQREANTERYQALEQRRKETDVFPFEGTYSFETTVEGAMTSGECAMAQTSTAISYLLSCRHPAGELTATATHVPGQLSVMWLVDGKLIVLNYLVDESDPNALVASNVDRETTTGRLVRTGDLRPLADFPVEGVYRYERSLQASSLVLDPATGLVTSRRENGASESGECAITTDERLRSPPFHFACKSDSGESFSNTASNGDKAIYFSWTPRSGPAMGGLVIIVAPGYYEGAEAGNLLVGRNEYGADVRLVRTGDLAPEPGDAAPTATAQRASAQRAAPQRVPARSQPAEGAATQAQPVPPAGQAAVACSAEQVAGVYTTGYGPMDCKPTGNGLACCYGTRCVNKVELSFDASRQNLAGAWMYPNGRTGPLSFPISAACELQTGRWSYAERPNQTGMWHVRGRQ